MTPQKAKASRTQPYLMLCRRVVMSPLPRAVQWEVRMEREDGCNWNKTHLVVITWGWGFSEKANEQKQSHRTPILIWENPQLNFRWRFVPMCVHPGPSDKDPNEDRCRHSRPDTCA